MNLKKILSLFLSICAVFSVAKCVAFSSVANGYWDIPSNNEEHTPDDDVNFYAENPPPLRRYYINVDQLDADQELSEAIQNLQN